MEQPKLESKLKQSKLKQVLILYYSANGSTKAMANLIARGVESIDGVCAKIRTVPNVSLANVSGTTHDSLSLEGNFVTLDDLQECDGLALGSPVRFGVMSAHLKYFLDSTSPQWLTGALINKPACVFTSGASIHGGQEACLLSMMIPLLHHGMLIMGIPYSENQLMQTKSGGTPYGVSHVSGVDGDNLITSEEKQLAIIQGKRLAEIVIKL